MKRFLPLLASAILAAGSITAAVTPAELPGMRLSGISPDGTWAAGSDEDSYTFVILNLQTGEEFWYGLQSDEPETYSAGLGKFVSNTGVVVASNYSTDMGCYWEKGEWHDLPLNEGDMAAYPNAITPDGSRITGSVAKARMSVDAEVIMAVPVVWDRNAEGGYDLYVEVDHPTTDWTGRLPQYVLVDDITDDGKVLAGDLVDYAGFAQQPIIFTEGADGKWSYKLLNPEIVNPGNVEFPPYPGESPDRPDPLDYMTPEKAKAYTEAYEEWMYRPTPELTDYMSDEEYEAYEAAMNAYFEDWENNPYPYAQDFMTEEELAEYNADLDAYYAVPAPDVRDYMTGVEYNAYEAACTEWEKAYDKWQVEYMEFTNVYWDAVVNPAALTLTMNSARISPNGRYYTMDNEYAYIDPSNPWGYGYASSPVLFDIQKGTYKLVDGGISDVLASMVFDNGAIIGATPSNDYSRTAAISKSAGEDFVLISDLVKEADTQTYAWMEENMTHEIINFEYVFNEETGQYDEVITSEEKMLTGTPVATYDLKTLVTWTYNNWEMGGESYYSYILPLNLDIDGISDLKLSNDTCVITLDRNGVLTISGDVAHAAIYDINGREVYSVKGATTAKTGLQGGIYVVKATTASGKTIVKKAAI